MKITDIQAIPLAIPIEAPLLFSTGVHPGRLQRTIIKIFTDEGIIGLSDIGGGDQTSSIEMIKKRVIGESPFNLNKIKHKIIRQVYYLYNPRLYAAIEMACLDIQGKYASLPLHDLLGGKVRDDIPVAGYLFYRNKNEKTGKGGEQDPESMVKWSRELIKKSKYKCLKLKCGSFSPWHDLKVMKALREAFPEVELRIDPNGYWAQETAIRVCQKLDEYDLEYIEDPTWGLAGMAKVREKIKTPLSTNMCVMDFDHLPPAVEMKAVDVILSDIFYWSGIRGVLNLACICDTFKIGISMHSGVEFGITMAAMLHTSSVISNLVHDIDQHYHHLEDDIIIGGKMPVKDGHMKVPSGPGLGVEIDEEKLNKYHEYYLKEKDYYANFLADKNKKEWYPMMPGW